MSDTPTPATVTAFVVHGKAANSAEQELGLFYQESDALKFKDGLAPSDWGHTRIETRKVPVGEVHEAHRDLFPNVTFPSTPSK